MQLQINAETVQLNRVVEERGADAMREQLQVLADRQGQLAELVEQLVSPAAAGDVESSLQPEQQSEEDVSGLDELDRELELLLQ